MFRNALAPIILAIVLSISVPARAAGKSLGITYGPTDQVVFSLDWPRWGIYAQPILSWQETDNSLYSAIDVGGRVGAQFAYTPFTYRALECRLLGGAGPHLAVRTITNREEVEFRTRQLAFEVWMQPEFRFYERFSVLLQAQMFRYVREDSFMEDSFMHETEDQRADFELPELSLSELRIGLKYYLPFGSW